MKIAFIKLLDRIAGGVAAVSLPAARPRAAASPKSILVIRPGGIGDAVLLAPALMALKASCPGCSVDVLAETRNAAAFRLVAAVRTVHCYDTRSGIADALKGRYDLVIDSEQWYRLSAVVARLTRARTLIGFSTNLRKRLFTHPVPYSPDEYEAFSFFRLLEPLGIGIPSALPVPFLEPPAAAVAAAEKLLAPLSGRPFVTVFPGASVSQKQWGPQRFRELVSKLALYGMPVVVVGGDAESGVAEAIARPAGALNLAGKASLEVTAAVIGKGRALVSGDSGLLHIAAGLGTPTVSLFGPSDSRKWAPRGEHHVALEGGLPCAPCSRFGSIPPCADAGDCLSGITVVQVLDALEKLLSGREG